MKCIICHEKEATIPDRNEPWYRRKKICTDCHVERLKNDFVNIVDAELKKRGLKK